MFDDEFDFGVGNDPVVTYYEDSESYGNVFEDDGYDAVDYIDILDEIGYYEDREF